MPKTEQTSVVEKQWDCISKLRVSACIGVYKEELV